MYTSLPGYQLTYSKVKNNDVQKALTALFEGEDLTKAEVRNSHHAQIVRTNLS